MPCVHGELNSWGTKCLLTLGSQKCKHHSKFLLHGLWHVVSGTCGARDMMSKGEGCHNF
jgi:hypothetical protein